MRTVETFDHPGGDHRETLATGPDAGTATFVGLLQTPHELAAARVVDGLVVDEDRWPPRMIVGLDGCEAAAVGVGAEDAIRRGTFRPRPVDDGRIDVHRPVVQAVSPAVAGQDRPCAEVGLAQDMYEAVVRVARRSPGAEVDVLRIDADRPDVTPCA